MGAENEPYIDFLSIDPHFFVGSRPKGRRRVIDRVPHDRDHRGDGDLARMGVGGHPRICAPSGVASRRRTRWRNFVDRCRGCPVVPPRSSRSCPNSLGARGDHRATPRSANGRFSTECCHSRPTRAAPRRCPRAAQPPRTWGGLGTARGRPRGAFWATYRGAAGHGLVGGELWSMWSSKALGGFGNCFQNKKPPSEARSKG